MILIEEFEFQMLSTPPSIKQPPGEVDKISASEERGSITTLADPSGVNSVVHFSRFILCSRDYARTRKDVRFAN